MCSQEVGCQHCHPLLAPRWQSSHPVPHCSSLPTGWTFEFADSQRFRNALGDALYTYREHKDSFRCGAFTTVFVHCKDTGVGRFSGVKCAACTHCPAQLHSLPFTAPGPLAPFPHLSPLSACRRALQMRGMQQDLSWEHAAELYEDVLMQAKFQW